MQVLLVTGTVGVGKSTVGFAAAERAASRGTPAAFLDLDQMSRLWPAPLGDPFREELAHANLGAVVPNYRSAGALLLVLAWAIDRTDEIAHLARTVGSPVTAVRLTAPPEVTEQRLRDRHRGPEAGGLEWHLRRAPELAAIQAHLDLPVIDATGPVGDVADRVLEIVGGDPADRG